MRFLDRIRKRKKVFVIIVLTLQIGIIFWNKKFIIICQSINYILWKVTVIFFSPGSVLTSEFWLSDLISIWA